MIKKAKKSVAIGLSVALAVTSVNIPVDSASAAAKKAKLSATKKTLTAGKSTTLTLKTNKKKAKTIKTIKAKYVKVSTSKKSVATVKKVSKKSKFTGVKVTAKKAGKATITVKVTKGTYKGTYKCKVTVKKKVSATKAPTKAPTTEPTVEPTQEPTQEPTAEPASSPAISAEPTATPEEVKATVTKAGDILKDGKTFKVTLSFEKEVKADDLKDTAIKLTKDKTEVTGKFITLDASGKAVYEISDDADVKALTPGDTTANGTYKVTSDSKVLVLNDITSVYEEALAGNAISGYVTTLKDGKYIPVANAVVSVDGGESKTTDANGYYKLPSVNGQKKVTVTAATYLDNNNNGKRVYVNRNHVTSQNFVMESYDVHKVFANITVQDADKTAVEGATVSVVGSANNEVASAVTNANGVVSFANKNVAASSLTGKVKQAASWEQYFVNDQTYTVYVEKKISDSNLRDVFVKQKIGTITVGNKYDYSDTMTATRVKKTPSLTLTQTLADNDVAAAVVDTTTKKMTTGYTVYTTVNGYVQKLYSTSDIQTAEVKNNAVATDLIDRTGLKDATLPTGDYFVVVNPTYTGSVRAAIAAVKVSVTEGSAAASSVTITRGYLRELETNVALTTEEEKAQGTITAGKDLNTVFAQTNGYAVTASSSAVTVDYAVYQVVDGVDIPIDSTKGQTVTATAKKTFTASGNEYNRLLGTGTYKITVEGEYIANETKTESINNKVNEKLTYNVDAAWNLIQANIKATDKSVFDSSIMATDAKLMKVVAKNVSTGESTTIFDAKGVVNDGIKASNATGAAISAGTELKYEIPVSKVTNLKSGKYTLTYSINGYKDVTSSEVTTIGLLEAENSVETALVKATADKTSISGKITYKTDAGVVEALSGVTAVNGTKPLVMLLDGNGKLAAVAEIDANGNYVLTDGEHSGVDSIVGGTYKMIVRANGYETKAVDVTVDANKQIKENVELEVGGVGAIKAVVTDTNINAIDDKDSVPVAYDAYYVVPATWLTVSGKEYGTLLTAGTYNVGAYTGTKDGKIFNFNNLSAGTYTVRAGEINWATTTNWGFKSTDAYKYEDKTVTIKGNGDKVYPEWEFAKIEAAGSGLVNLTVNFDTSAQTAVHKGVYVVVVTDEDGNIETSKIELNAAATSTNVSVKSGKAYTVTLYTASGYQVTSSSVNVQKIDTSVSLTASVANVD